MPGGLRVTGLLQFATAVSSCLRSSALVGCGVGMVVPLPLWPRQIRAQVYEGCQNDCYGRGGYLIEHADLLANGHVDPRSVLDRTLER